MYVGECYVLPTVSLGSDLEVTWNLLGVFFFVNLLLWSIGRPVIHEMRDIVFHKVSN